MLVPRALHVGVGESVAKVTVARVGMALDNEDAL